jgi:D-serine deaminase-like pyridoxal phosphate-dependent protein
MHLAQAPFAGLDPAGYALPGELAERALTPALVVHMGALRHNLARAIELCGGDAARWRPHVKTTKIPAVMREVARAGVRHFKCATTREAAVLLDALQSEGIADGDVLLAYPLVGPALQRLARLAARHPRARIAVLCDVPEAVRDVPTGLGVFLDVNPGMDRTGAPLEDEPRILATAREAGERLRGLHFYDGHLHQADRGERALAVHAGYDRLLELARALERAGTPCGELITAGTPAFADALAYEGFGASGAPRHRVSPGTVVFHDARSEELCPELGLRPAALVLTRVVSHPAADLATCDAGSKSLAAEAGEPCAIVLGRADLEALKPSEEHLPLRGVPGALPSRGELLQLVPRHVCPTVNLAEEALLVENGRLVDVVPVSARAHELFPDCAAACTPRPSS